jgi:hypothetical protein
MTGLENRISRVALHDRIVGILPVLATFYFVGCSDIKDEESLNQDGSDAPPASVVYLHGDASENWKAIDNPESDHWKTEAVQTVIQKQLDLLAGIVSERAAGIGGDQLSNLVDDEVVFTDLVPRKLRMIFKGSSFVVERPAEKMPPGRRGVGVVSFAEELQALRGSLNATDQIRWKFKVAGIESGELVSTRLLVESSGRSENHVVQQNAVWNAEWRSEGETLRIQSIELADFEQTSTGNRSDTLFVDCTGSVFGDSRSFRNQFALGYDYWLDRIQDMRSFVLLGTPGIALGDVNGDGLEDLYVCQEGGLPNRLYVQQPDGALLDTTSEANVGWLESSRSALILDFDNDGDQDLAVTFLGELVFAANDGMGRFEIATSVRTGTGAMALSAADFDGDADLDVYVASYSADDLTEEDAGGVVVGGGANLVYYDANSGGRNQLFRNDHLDGAWSFRDVTGDVGLDVNNRRFSLAASWEDFDNDGDQDLYVGNDFGLNNLYRYDGEDARFIDVATETKTRDQASGMSVSWSDFNRDGFMDLYVGNMFSAAGRRITTQKQFNARAPAEVRSALQEFARGNTLLANRSGEFDNVTASTGTAMGRWAWSSSFADINNDGWDDLVVANGYITTEDSGDL